MSSSKDNPIPSVSAPAAARCTPVASEVTELPHIRLFVREGCHLCEIAQADLEEVLASLPVPHPNASQPADYERRARDRNIKPVQADLQPSHITANPDIATGHDAGHSGFLVRLASRFWRRNPGSTLQSSRGHQASRPEIPTDFIPTVEPHTPDGHTANTAPSAQPPTDYWNVHYINIDTVSSTDPHIQASPLPDDAETFTIRVPVLEVNGNVCLDLQFNQQAIRTAIATYWEF